MEPLHARIKKYHIQREPKAAGQEKERNVGSFLGRLMWFSSRSEAGSQPPERRKRSPGTLGEKCCVAIFVMGNADDQRKTVVKAKTADLTAALRLFLAAFFVSCGGLHMG